MKKTLLTFLFVFFIFSIFSIMAPKAYALPVARQFHFRFRNDDGSESTATWQAAEDTNIVNQAKQTNFRIRIETKDSGTNSLSVAPQLEYILASGSTVCTGAGWTKITTSTSNAFALSVSSNFADGAVTTEQLTSVGITSFIAGKIFHSTNPATTSLVITAGNGSEHEWSIQATSNASDSTAYLIRLTKGGVLYDAYDICPQVTLAAAAISIPTLTTSAPTSVSTTTATLNASISATGGADATQSGFAYGTVANLSTVISTSTLGAQTGTASFLQNISSLTPNTIYYFRAYATNSGGTGYGSILSTTTLAVSAPTVTTQAVSSIAATTATGNGNITVTGNINPTIRGVVYGTSIAYGATTTEAGDFSTGAFSASITSLTCNTLYHVKAYATNSQGTGYGFIMSFTTDACPAIISTPAVTSSSVSSTFSTSQVLMNVPGCPAGYSCMPIIPPRIPNCPIGYTCTPAAPSNVISSPVSTPIYSVIFVNAPRQYSTSRDVTILQDILRSLGFLKHISTGYFGPLTIQAVKAYQKAHNIQQTGMLGPLTRAALMKGN